MLTRPEPVAVSNDGAPEWEVERILDHRRSGRRKILQYLILWKGYPQHEATWEPIECLDGARKFITDYNKRKKIVVSTTEVLEIRSYADAVRGRGTAA